MTPEQKMIVEFVSAWHARRAAETKSLAALAEYKAVDDPGFANLDEAFAKLEVHEAALSELAKAKVAWDEHWKRLFEMGKQLGAKVG